MSWIPEVGLKGSLKLLLPDICIVGIGALPCWRKEPHLFMLSGWESCGTSIKACHLTLVRDVGYDSLYLSANLAKESGERQAAFLCSFPNLRFFGSPYCWGIFKTLKFLLNWVVKNFSVQRMTDGYEAVYQQILAERFAQNGHFRSLIRV